MVTHLDDQRELTRFRGPGPELADLPGAITTSGSGSDFLPCRTDFADVKSLGDQTSQKIGNPAHGKVVRLLLHHL